MRGIRLVVFCDVGGYCAQSLEVLNSGDAQCAGCGSG